MSLQPNFEVLWIEQVLKKPSKTNASKHSIHFPPFQGHKKSIRNSLFSNSLSKMLHFFSMKFATTLDFTGFPVISHLFTDGLTLECPFVRYSVKLQIRKLPQMPVNTKTNLKIRARSFRFPVHAGMHPVSSL